MCVQRRVGVKWRSANRESNVDKERRMELERRMKGMNEKGKTGKMDGKRVVELCISLPIFSIYSTKESRYITIKLERMERVRERNNEEKRINGIKRGDSTGMCLPL